MSQTTYLSIISLITLVSFIFIYKQDLNLSDEDVFKQMASNSNKVTKILQLHLKSDKMPKLNNGTTPRPQKSEKSELSCTSLLRDRAADVITKCGYFEFETENDSLYNFKKHLTWEMIAEPEHDIFGCVPLRASSSTWNYFWYLLHNKNEKNSVGLSAFSWYERNTLTKFLKKIPVNDLVNMSRSENSFMVVRHPIPRFFSAFKLKFKITDLCKNIPENMQNMNKTNSEHKNCIKKRHVPEKFDSIFETSGIPVENYKKYKTLPPWPGFGIHPEDLINAIYDQHTTFNAHFQSQVLQCNPCEYRYSNVLKVENMEEDAVCYLDHLEIENGTVRNSLLVGRNRDGIDNKDIYNENIGMKIRQRNKTDKYSAFQNVWSGSEI